MLHVAAVLAFGANYNFLSVGDWGGVAVGHGASEHAVAQQMAATAAAHGSQMVLNTGDNFYWCGVRSPEDDLFRTDYEEVFNQTSLAVPWINSLGNHDYGYSVEAQINYTSPLGDRWIMDDRYYTRRVALPLGKHMTIVVLDTNPCVKAYRSDNKSGWDPCSGKYPGECPDCQFHQNIVAQDCGAQLAWFEKALAAVPAADWLVVMGHHPIFEIDVEDFAAPILKRKVDLYLNGHSHYFAQYEMDGAGVFVTTGAGSMVDVATTDDHDAFLKTAAAYKHHAHSETFYKKVAGFTMHTFNEDLTELTTDYVDYNGKTVHSVTAKKL
eukprot:TRINITY_DN15969_c0_g1_i1.p2 TRINITY_DN15969_c0_g1~~TRINITY_DN15969_c0_g1_i1.p2  ORF type:complete len:325 (+),score=132.50 TRINITY_DN15969_c0_g1_i1:63-1037(+)